MCFLGYAFKSLNFSSCNASWCALCNKDHSHYVNHPYRTVWDHACVLHYLTERERKRFEVLLLRKHSVRFFLARESNCFSTIEKKWFSPVNDFETVPLPIWCIAFFKKIYLLLQNAQQNKKCRYSLRIIYRQIFKILKQFLSKKTRNWAVWHSLTNKRQILISVFQKLVSQCLLDFFDR